MRWRRGRGAVHAGDLVARTGLPKATAHRLAAALEAHGLLRRDDEGRYLLGRPADRARATRRRRTGRSPTRPARRSSTCERATGESVQLYVRDGDHRVCVVSLESPHELRTIVAEGARLPLGSGSAGRILAGEATAERWMASVGERAPGSRR